MKEEEKAEDAYIIIKLNEIMKLIYKLNIHLLDD